MKTVVAYARASADKFPWGGGNKKDQK